jgi:ABC-type phosphate transport system substrate-binding protein
METSKMNFMKAIVAAGLVAASTSAFAADITGAGATFPFPLYSKWADAYKKETGNGLNYQSIGSGAGIKQIQAKTVTFGASDMPLKPEQLGKGRADSMAAGDGCLGASRESRRYQARRAGIFRRIARRYLSGKGQNLE